ncbi:segregation and condensation protein A [Mesoplasma lactucae]|uniref:Segregation and condensation protein A n=1 Tax=Mesoplasma lactucae ATCC 49193 TaxID=81460 RepID=A0A291IRC2_9MOLU|nr:segregation/condensation protein A [Mesoplasma lactucae]ATG97276.1 hypothetical protein CP520_00690 [Mesoplasma lactucae ATCC 49193]ATZ20274.1 segregation and condensation protein A [Mesoplasma lactucae ATCC 49193]MCL8216445.1 Segregation and condensation protein A [Mesoplasma lactucae ATCC 49193]
MERWSEIKISDFDGPFDLFYEMIREKKIDIFDVDLLQVIDQYLDYIHHQQLLDIEVAAEYFLMAATLLEMKSRWLLPRQKEVAEDEEELSYEQFVQQLSEMQQIRSVSEFLNKKQEEYFETRSPQKSKRKFAYEPVELEEPEFSDMGLDMNKFAEIYKRALKKHQQDLIDSDDYDDFVSMDDFNTIETNVLSPNEVAGIVLDKMRTDRLNEFSIFDILPAEMFNLTNLISVFLAALDLVKYQIITVRQDEERDDLLFRFTKYALENPEAVNGLEVESYE